jgi:hypothetical protein
MFACLRHSWVCEPIFDGSAHPKKLMHMVDFLPVLRHQELTQLIKPSPQNRNFSAPLLRCKITGVSDYPAAEHAQGTV